MGAGAECLGSELSPLPRPPQLACGVLWFSGYGHAWSQNARDLISSLLTLLKQLGATVSKLQGTLGKGGNGVRGPSHSPTPRGGVPKFGRYCLPSPCSSSACSPPQALGRGCSEPQFGHLEEAEDAAATSTLTCLSTVPQAWLGAGAWGLPSLLLLSLSVGLLLVAPLVRHQPPQAQASVPPSPPAAL